MSQKPLDTKPLDRSDPELTRRVVGLLGAKILRARESIEDFMELVMVEETSRKPIKLAPHQRVGLRFIMDNDRSVSMWPVGCAKTFTVAGISMFLLGQDPTTRGVIVSATEDQAKKPLGMVAEYIFNSPILRHVFPHLRPSSRVRDPWTQTAITIERPHAIRDPSLVARGFGSQSITGSRLNWVVVDDLLSFENTSTKESRDKVYRWFDSSVLSRLDPKGARIVIVNTAWHPDDLVHRLKAAGWPTLRMDIFGDIEINDDPIKVAPFPEGYGCQPWDSEEIRPSTPNPNDHLVRLSAHDPDPYNEVPLWPEKYSRHFIESVLMRRHLPIEFARAYRNLCRDDSSAFCKQEYIDLCKRLARELGYFSLVSEYNGENPTFTGVDLAIKPGEHADSTAFFTFEILPDHRRRILDIEIAQMDGPTIVNKTAEKHRKYKSIVSVEDNAAQDFIRQFTLFMDVSLPIEGFRTGAQKAHPQYGVPSIFLEMANGAWLIPNDTQGYCHPVVQQFVDSCLYWEPTKHYPDELMACYFAREKCKEWGYMAGGDTADLMKDVSLSIR